MMKKSLIALAVIAASGAAMAQSSVTLYGVADAGIGRDKIADGPNAKTRVTDGTDNVNNGASRVGFTGVEDLGNGNKVGFQFEAGLSLANGSTDANFWQRQANVFVGGNWGTIKAGRQFTVTHLAEGAYELMGLPNYSVIRGTYNAIGIGARADAALAYISPNFGGFTAAVAFVSKNNTGLNHNVWDAGLIYNNGPIGAGLSVNKGLDDGKTNYQLGARYNFGNFAVAASYHQASGNDYVAPTAADPIGTPDLVRRGFSLGGQATFGAFTVTLDVTRDTKREVGFDAATGAKIKGKKYTNAVLEAKYALSKRTFFYGDVLRLDGTTNWGLGIHHSF